MTDIKEKIQIFYPKVELLRQEVSKKVIWQHTLVRDILLAVFAGGHILIEWAPGLAKTLTVDTLAKTLALDFKRIQFTPDLLPSDLIGAQVYNPTKNEFWVKFWPIFTNFVLADEINRAPSKVQSALLEAMAEKQVSIGDTTYPLWEHFIVLATQNPIEQEGTFSLPEAQLDRFLLKTIVDYPTQEEEIEILKTSISRNTQGVQTVFSSQDITEIKSLIDQIYVDEKVFQYIRDIVFFTREQKDPILKYIHYPASPRASLALLKTAKVLAFLSQRDFVLPEDIKEVAYPVLRHRLSLNYEAYADNVKIDTIIDTILQKVEIF